MREYRVERDKRICIYDNLFDLKYRQDIYTFAQNSYFTIGWADSNIIENQGNRFLHSIYSLEDLNNLGIVHRIINSEAGKELEGYDNITAVLNLSTAADTNYVHAHPESKILLYYVNIEWRDGWHGETLFYSEDLKDVAFASAYTPGRLLVFDASIPHTIRPQSHIAAQYRFTLALVLEKNANCS